MSHRPGKLFSLLTLAILAWAQVFGMARGYICDCGNVAQITAMDHCHGPHSISCHETESAAHCVDDHEDGKASHSDSDRHQHEPLKETVVARQAMQLALELNPPVAWIWLTPLSTSLELTARPPLSSTSHRLRVPDDGGGGAHQWPEVLTHTIALRV